MECRDTCSDGEPLRKKPKHGGFDSDALLKDASVFQWDEFPMNHFCCKGSSNVRIPHLRRRVYNRKLG